jgi:hypothetical protein
MSKIVQRLAGWFQLLFIVAVVGAAILVSIALQPESSTRVAAGASAAVPVSVVAPEPIEFQPTVRLNGVVATRTLTSVVPQVGGRVVEVSASFRPGASFAKGDVLFRIDPDDYELAVERTLAEIEAARSELALLGDAVERRASILREGEETASLEVVRQGASLDERTRLRTLYLAADNATNLTLGEFVSVEIRGDAAAETVQVPVASLTSRNQVWVVDEGVLRPRLQRMARRALES